MKLLLGADRLPLIPERRKRRRDCTINPHVLWLVFLRLPLKSLFRCKAVCKAFHSVVSDPLFSADYRRCSPRTPSGEPACVGIFIVRGGSYHRRNSRRCSVRFVSCGSNNRYRIPIEKEVSYYFYPNPSSRSRHSRFGIPPYYKNYLLASSGGVLLFKGIELAPQSDYGGYEYYVVNTLTKEWRALPDLPNHGSLGPSVIGFVCREGDPSVTGACHYNYEVVIISMVTTRSVVIGTYSSRVHEWSVVSIPSEFRWWLLPDCMKDIGGVFYWISQEKLGSYDPGTCKIEQSPLPDAGNANTDSIGGGANGALLLYTRDRQGFDVWVKDDCRQRLHPWRREHRKEWLEIEMLVQSLSSGVAEHSINLDLWRLKAFTGNPDKVFMVNESEFFIYDWRTDKLEMLHCREGLCPFELLSWCHPYHLPSWHFRL